MNISEAAKKSGISAKMIRYYERIGLIPEARRSDSGYRVYDGEDLHSLGFIRRARDLGFTVKQIEGLLALWHDRERASSEVKSMATTHILELKTKIDKLQQMMSTLEHLAANCHGDERPHCPILEGLQGSEGYRDQPSGGGLSPSAKSSSMEYLHTMVRISNIEESLNFYCNLLQMKEVRRKESEKGRFTLIFLAADGDCDKAEQSQSPLLELTYNWDPEEYQGGRHCGHLAFRVDNIYQPCQRLQDGGVTICRPPRDGYMAFVRSPDGISVELLQAGEPLEPAEPWSSMASTGTW